MPENTKPLWDHVLELRNVAIKILIVWVLSTLVTVFYSDQVFEFITGPLDGRQIFFFSPADSVVFLVKIHLMLGFIIGFPLILWFVWKYLIDVFEAHQKKYINSIIPVGLILAYIGVVYGYFFLIPQSVQLLIGIKPEGTEFMISADEYVGFVLGLLVIIVSIFQVPLVIFSSIKSKLVKAEFYQKRRREFYLGFITVTAVFTPTPDAFTLLLIVIPMIIFFELALFLGKW